jgi:hypothetical protein
VNDEGAGTAGRERRRLWRKRTSQRDRSMSALRSKADIGWTSCDDA